MSLIQLILNFLVFGANGVTIFAIGWALDRWMFPRLQRTPNIMNGVLIAIALAAALWFTCLWYFGDRINLYGTVLMAGTGGLIATILAVLVHRHRSKQADGAGSDIGDIFA